ncbi:MAG: acyl carrier protein [Bryobacterales bacterium]
MLTPNDIRGEIRRLVAEVTELEPDEIRDDANYQEELDMDSLMAMEIMVAVDKKFRIEVPEEEFLALENIDQTVDAVMRHIQQAKAS